MTSAIPRQVLIVGELRTGRRLMAMPVSSLSWSVAAGSPGSIEATIPTSAEDFQRMSELVAGGLLPALDLEPDTDLLLLDSTRRWVADGRMRDDLRVATEPVRMFAAVVVGGRVIEAGPIWQREESADGTLMIRATGLASVFDYRLLLSHLVSWSTPGAVAASTLTYSGLSLGTIAKRLVEAAVAHTGGDLPVVLPADISGVHTQTYPGYEMAMVAQRLQQLSELEGGPEIAFEPRLTADRQGIEWVMRTGTDEDPELHQEGLDWVVDTTAPQGGVVQFTIKEDASAQTFRAFAKGSGTDTATLISSPAARTDFLDAGYPLLDSVRTYSTVTVPATLDSHARADLAANDRPWTTWNLTIPVDGRLGQYRPGDWWTVRTGKRVLVDAGAHRVRLASMRGSAGSDTVDLAMVPEEVAG